MNKNLIHYLSQFVTEHKRDLIEKTLQNRTRYLTVVLEDIYQTHNASAVLRSCECLGIQDVHAIEQKNPFLDHPDITLGSSKWLTLNRHKTTKECLSKLKKEGYQIAAMTLNENSIPLQELDLNQKTAVCFGTEENGLSETAHEMADVFVKIPMHGFTQSFNISVSAALTLFSLTEKLRSTEINWHLSDEEKQIIELDWLTKIAPKGELLKKEFLKKNV